MANFHDLLLDIIQIEIEKLVGGNAEKRRNGGNQGNVGKRGVRFPFGNGLERNAEKVCERFLRNVFCLSQFFDLLSEFDHMNLLCLCYVKLLIISLAVLRCLELFKLWNRRETVYGESPHGTVLDFSIPQKQRKTITLYLRIFRV